MNKRLIVILGISVLSFGLAIGCSQAEEEGPMEEAGAAVDQAVEETQEAVQEAGEAIGDAAQEAGQAVENAPATN